MTFWGVLIWLAIVAGVVGVVGAVRLEGQPPRWVPLAPAALVGAMLGQFFFHLGPRVGGLAVVPVAIGALLLSLLMRLVDRLWGDAFYGPPRSPTR